MNHPEFDAASLIKTALMKTGREGRGIVSGNSPEC
jgi:hypothetical protein